MTIPIFDAGGAAKCRHCGAKIHREPSEHEWRGDDSARSSFCFGLVPHLPMPAGLTGGEPLR